MIVYIITMIGGGGLSKIGHTTNIKGRLSAMQTDNPHPLHHTLSLLSGEKLERELHKEFKKRGKWFRGEWFRLEEQDIMWVIGNYSNIVTHYKKPSVNSATKHFLHSTATELLKDTNTILKKRLEEMERKLERIRGEVWREMNRGRD